MSLLQSHISICFLIHVKILLEIFFSFSRTSLASMAGISAGILGLTGLKGFIFYFIASFFMSVSTSISLYMVIIVSGIDFTMYIQLH